MAKKGAWSQDRNQLFLSMKTDFSCATVCKIICDTVYTTASRKMYFCNWLPERTECQVL